MIFNYFDFSTSMLIAGFSILLVSALISFLGRRSMKAIPIDNLRERLLCVVKYAAWLPFLFFLYTMLFQVPFLGVPTDFDTPQSLFQKYYTQIESIKTVQFAMNYTLFFGGGAILDLLRVALKAEN